MAGDVGHGSGCRTTDEYIYRRRRGGRARGWLGWRWGREERRKGGDSVNGILLGHPFTRTRRKLEDLIWRAVWIAFALAMPPIEPSVIYVHIYTRITRAHLYTQAHGGRGRTRERRRVHACVHVRTRCTRRSSLHENAVRSFCSFVPFVPSCISARVRTHR